MTRTPLLGALIGLLIPTLVPAAESSLTTKSYPLEPSRFEGLFSLTPWGQLVLRPPSSDLDPAPIDRELPVFGAFAPIWSPAGEGEEIEISDPPEGIWSGGPDGEQVWEWIQGPGVASTENEETEPDPVRTEFTHGRIIVTASRDVQARAGKLLEAIAALATEEIAVDCALVPVDVLKTAAPDESWMGSIVTEAAFDAMLREPRTQLVSLTARRGAKATATSREAQGAVVAQEVNQTGVIPVVNPVVKGIPTGFKVELRAASVEEGERVWLRLVAGSFRGTLRQVDSDADQFGTLELPTVDQTLLSTTVVVPAGEPTIVGLSELHGKLALVVRAQPRSDRARLTRDPLGDGTLWLASIPDLAGADERPWPTPQEGRLEAFSPAYRDPDDVLSEALHRGWLPSEEIEIGLEASPTGVVLAWGRSTSLESLRRGMGELEAEAHRTASVVLELWNVPRARALEVRAAAARGKLLPDGWADGLTQAEGGTLRRMATTSAHGETVGLFDAEVATYLVGSDQVSGGTGFAIVERSQPQTATCGTGGGLWLRADFSDDGGSARLRVEAADAVVEEVRSVEAVFPNLAGYVSEDEGSDAEMARTSLKLELPRQRVTHFAVDVTVPIGRDALLQTRLDGDRGTLLVGRVHRTP
jgi:hypothetical protein